MTRQALHAHSLSFEHPVSGELMRFEAPLAPDLEQLINRFGLVGVRLRPSGAEGWSAWHGF